MNLVDLLDKDCKYPLILSNLVSLQIVLNYIHCFKVFLVEVLKL